ncbi:cytochrome P450, partial [Lactifluus volemus]
FSCSHRQSSLRRLLHSERPASSRHCCTIIPNTWAILHDPEIYPDPEVFSPERFLNQDGSLRDDPMVSLAFGAGKRICSGRHFVMQRSLSLSRLCCPYLMSRRRGMRMDTKSLSTFHPLASSRNQRSFNVVSVVQ